MNALVAQLVEATVLEAVQCQFESDRGHQISILSSRRLRTPVSQTGKSGSIPDKITNAGVAKWQTQGT